MLKRLNRWYWVALIVSFTFVSLSWSLASTALVSKVHSSQALSSTKRSSSFPGLWAPSLQPYNLSTEGVGSKCRSSYSQLGQDLILWPILKQINNGFFVEAGARDGESHTNTLLYELSGWSGLLVEPGYEFEFLLQKHRKAWAFKGALSTTPRMEYMSFQDSGYGNSRLDTDNISAAVVPVLASPLGGLLEHIGVTVVDFWSLDIEGSEGAVLSNIDFRHITVGVLLVEMSDNDKNNKLVYEVMAREGFIDVGVIRHHHHHWFGISFLFSGRIIDHIFVNPRYFRDLGLSVPGQLDTWYTSACDDMFSQVLTALIGRAHILAKRWFA